MVLPGCLEANRISVIIYDANRDMFRHLRLYLDIASDETQGAKDYDRLIQIYKLRGSFVPTPVPLLSSAFDIKRRGIVNGEAGVLVVANHTYDRVKLNSPPLRTSSNEQTALALDDIAIQPGRFFRSERGTLCYYHQTEIPGKLVDQLLAEAWVSHIREPLRNMIAKEQERRRSGGSVKPLKMIADEAERRLRDGRALLSGDRGLDSETDKPKKEFTPAAAFDDTSLRLLLAKAKSDEIGFRREKNVLKVQCELSASDVSQLRRLWAFLQEDEKRHPKDYKVEEVPAVILLRGMSVESVPIRSMPGTVRVTVRLDLQHSGNSDVVKLLRAEVYKKDKGTVGARKHARRAAAVSEVLKRGVVVSQTARTINQVIDSFRQGTLK